nr:retrovirus-related Pol polyprotein from transposon TNT 1-94 [Tanacetum cinerariifolium]
MSLITSNEVRKFRLQRPGSLPKSGFIKETNPSLLFMQRHIKEPIWYLDSGCSRSMSGVMSYQHKYVEQPGAKVVFGDNSSCITKGYGSINYGGIVFTKVAFVNGLKYNLISISQLCDANYIVQFDDKQGTIFNANKEIVWITPRRNDVYVLDMSSLTPNGACFFAKSLEIITGYGIKGYHILISRTLISLPNKTKVLGLPSLVYAKDKPCTTCEKGKRHRTSFKTKQNFSIRKFLHLLHMDLFGPFEKLMTKKFEMSMMGELIYFLGLKIKPDDKRILIFQEQYTRNLLKKYDISDSSLVKTPMVPPNYLGPDIAGNPVNETSYRRMIRYLKGTPTLGLYCPKCSSFDLKGYSDSDYVGCNMHRKSTSGIPHQVSVLNGQRPLTLDFKNFCSSTGLDYNNGKYVDHPTPKVVKKELGKIAINPSYLDKTPVLKNSFLMAWRILFAFAIQVLGGNYSFIEQVKSIQHLLAYNLIIRTEVDIEEIIYSDLVTKLLNKSRLKYVSYSRFISCALQALLGPDYYKIKNLVSLPPLAVKPKKGKSRTVTSTSPKSQGPEASGALSKKCKRPKSKKPPTETKEDQTHSSRLRYQSLTENEGEPSYEGEPDTQPMLLSYADVCAILLSEDEAQESKKDILRLEKHEEAVVYYVNLKSIIDDYYNEYIAHRDQTDNLVEASMSSLEKSSSTINDLYKGLEVITQLLKDTTNSVKDDPATNKKIEEASKTLAKISTQTTGILSSTRSFDFFTLQSTVKNIQDRAFKQEEASAA